MSLTIEGVGAIVFDVDNTLVVCPSNDDAILAILRRHGCHGADAELMGAITAANSDWAIVERWLPPEERASAYAEVLDCNAVLAAQSEFDEFLATSLLALAAKYSLFIVSRRDRRSIECALTRHGVDHLFAEVVGAEMGGAEKPDPRDLLALLARHAIAPEAAIYVGDKGVDYDLAEAAGTQFVGAAWYEDLLPDTPIKAASVKAFLALFGRARRDPLAPQLAEIRKADTR